MLLRARRDAIHVGIWMCRGIRINSRYISREISTEVRSRQNPTVYAGCVSALSENILVTDILANLKRISLNENFIYTYVSQTHHRS